VTELVTGLTLGLAAGLAPGPLQALIVTTTLHRGFGAGWRVAIAPLLTDVVIVSLSVAVLSVLPDAVLTGLTVVGGTLLVGLGVAELVRARRPLPPEDAGGSSKDLATGALVNVTNPHAWLFWVTAGGPLLIRLYRASPPTAVGFLAAFYLALVGSKVGLAAVVAAVRHQLGDRARRRLLAAGGLLLVAGGVLIVVGGLPG